MFSRILKQLLVPVLPLLLFTAGLHAAPPVPPQVRTEIEALLSALEVSSCRFNRNGSWHAAPEAKRHLLRKLEYLEDKHGVQNTEQFIDLAATASSTSGREYLVQCGETEPLSSRQWLLAQLATIRSAADLSGPDPAFQNRP
ncbi:MAG: DUF5329 domain-containing protein [Desulforhopalus sp.]|nr:DUF5329 domain-containing protein [Desulforhopalus sp.]